MVEKIVLEGVASYKQKATLQTDKHVNLIYGLNGSGKSTLSEYFRNYFNNSDLYTKCSMQPAPNFDDVEFLVFNQSFIRENFYDTDVQKGIFTLSKGNAALRKKIEEDTKSIAELRNKIADASNQLNEITLKFKEERENLQTKAFKIKHDYAGGDRILEFCLTGVKNSKEKLFEKLCATPLTKQEPQLSIEQLKMNLQTLYDLKEATIIFIDKINFDGSSIEKDPIFQDVITGNVGSHVYKLINKLNNSDWVNMGRKFIGDVCPFCQQKLPDGFVEELQNYFNKDYENAIAQIENLSERYRQMEEALNKDLVECFNYPFLDKLKDEVANEFSILQNVLSKNIESMAAKRTQPSVVCEIQDTAGIVEGLNILIDKANVMIDDYKNKLANIKDEEHKIADEFWGIQRNQYNHVVTLYEEAKRKYEKDAIKLNNLIQTTNEKIDTLNSHIEEAQKNVINIDSAVHNINSNLLQMGIEDFYVKNERDKELYRIVRGGNVGIYETLSEGEKMLISFLYFIELCKGSLQRDGNKLKQKVVVIDDPISSLSTMYVYNVGRLISEYFYPDVAKDANGEKRIKDKKVEQLFVLTHNLYFFYELTEMKKENRDVYQKLFRISKTKDGSKIETMHYEEIQNDYQSYWHIINDTNTPPALLANCMRNIIEYFFGFVKKRDLNNTFMSLKGNRFDAFKRYINRESHSMGQNINDFKEFNYEDFREALRLVFVNSGYEEHYKEMSKL